MESVESQGSGAETQAEVDACLAAADTTLDQVRRWRREGLLPDVMQKQTPYSGSTVFYPVGTCAQIAAAARLFKVKNRTAYVGWQLWWEGFPVDEKYWKPQLATAAQRYDKGIKLIQKYVARDETEINQPTLQERVARSRLTNIVFSRIRGRLTRAGLAAHIGVTISMATGEFEQFALPGPDEIESFDKARTIDALDLEASKTDTVFGKRLELIRQLPVMLRAMAHSQEAFSLSALIHEDAEQVAQARNDVRNAFRIAVGFHEAMTWIYGPEAFGLRLAAWIGKKQPDWLIPLIILGMARLRRSSNEILSSEEIKNLAETAEVARRDSLALKALWKNDRRFEQVFAPKRIREGYEDHIAQDRFQKEIEFARLSEK